MKLVIAILAATGALAAFTSSAAAELEAPTTAPATEVTATAATLNAVLNPTESATASWYFFYAPEEECFNLNTPVNGPVTGLAVAVGAHVTGLIPNKLYTVCAVAVGENEEGGREEPIGEPITFTTAAVPPAVLAQSTSEVTGSSATLEARVNPENQATTECILEYGPTEAYGSAVACAGQPFAGVTAVHATAHVGGLQPGSLYHYRAVVSNATGTTEGEDATFVSAALPKVAEVVAQAASSRSVTLRTTIDPGGAVTTYHFVWVDDSLYQAALAAGAADPYARGGRSSLATLPAVNEQLSAAPATVDGLVADETYHVAVVAENAAGTIRSPDRVITLPPPTLPVATTEPVAAVGETSVVMSGFLDTHGLAGSYEFELGQLAGQYSSLGAVSVSEAASSGRVTVALSDLLPQSEYHYRLCVTTEAARVCGADLAFLTASSTVVAPTLISQFPDLSTETPQPPSRVPGIPHVVHRSKLANALRACARKPTHRRRTCRARAHRKYGHAAHRQLAPRRRSRAVVDRSR
jgi:hypothetical protein